MTDRLRQPQRPLALPVPRRRLTRVEFAQLMLDQDGRCAACREKLRADLIVDEHLTPLDQLGTNDLSNRALFCTACARAKTEDDLAEIRHGRRVRGEAGQKRTRALRKLKPWTQPRTFLTNRDGPLKRKMNGQVVARSMKRRNVRPTRTFYVQPKPPLKSCLRIAEKGHDPSVGDLSRQPRRHDPS